MSGSGECGRTGSLVLLLQSLERQTNKANLYLLRMIYIYISDTGGGDKGRGWCIARRVWLVGCLLSGWRGGGGEVEVHVA